MLWQIYKYTQAVQERDPSFNSGAKQTQQTKEMNDGLEEVEPELYEKPATLKLEN